MSIDVTTWVWEHSPAKSTHLLMLLALADHCNDNGVCYPSVGCLAAECRIGVRRAQQVIDALKRAGDIDVAIGQGVECNGGKTNRYYLNGYRRSIGLSSEPNPPDDDIPPAERGAPLPEGSFREENETSCASLPETLCREGGDAACAPLSEATFGEGDDAACTPLPEISCAEAATDFTTPPATDCTTPPATDFRQTVSINRHINHHSLLHTQVLPTSACAREAPPAGVCVGERDFSEDDAFVWASEHPFWSTRITNREALKRNLAEGKAFRAQFLATLAALKGGQAPTTADGNNHAASHQGVTPAAEDYHAAFWNHFGRAVDGTLLDPKDGD